MGLRQLLGKTPRGLQLDLTWEQVCDFLRTRYLSMPGTEVTGTVGIAGALLRGVQTTDPTDGERAIRENMRRRIALYRGKGKPYYEAMVDAMFSDLTNRAERKAMLPYADWQHAVRRIVDELSTVYSAPAKRSIASDDEKYQLILEALEWDATMDLANHMANLCNGCLLWLRPQMVDGEIRPRLDVVTRDCFAPIADPLDPRSLVGVILDCWPDSYRVQVTDPHYQVWTADEIFALDHAGRLVPGSVEPNPYGILPGVLLRSSVPICGLMEYDEGSDIVSGHFAAVFLNLAMLAGQKVGQKQPYATGDTSRLVRGQRMSPENLMEMGEGVQVGSLDLGIDPHAAISSAKSVLSQVAANHGIPEDAFTMVGAQVGPAQAEKRQAVKERRLRQVKTYRGVERALTLVLARWVEVSGPVEWRFTPDEWAIDFVEVATPMAPLELQQWREGERHAGRRSPVMDVMDDNPDFTEEQAQAHLVKVAQEIAIWVALMRKLNIRTDTTAENPGATPQENGAKGGRPPNGAGEDKNEMMGDMPAEASA